MDQSKQKHEDSEKIKPLHSTDRAEGEENRESIDETSTDEAIERAGIPPRE